MSDFLSRIEANEFTLIAEIGVNYYDIAEQLNISSLDAAKLMCSKAKEAGIHAVKFQTYTAGKLAARESPSYWNTKEEPTTSQYELFKKYDSFGENEYIELANYCNSLDIGFFSTAFDFESADYLEPLMSIYKVSSSDLTNIPFIEYQARKNKPMIVSVGASDLDEIKCAIEAIRKFNDQPLVICHCVLEYPTPYNHANLKRISTLKKEFPNLLIGYSDHCKPDFKYEVLKTAYILGAHIIEKHFTLDKTLIGNDHYHAMDQNDAKAIIKEIEQLESLLGNGKLEYLDNEKTARLNARRSIVAACDIPSNTIITKDMLTFKRPGTGISPSSINEVIGKKSSTAIPEDTIIKLDNLVIK